MTYPHTTETEPDRPERGHDDRAEEELLDNEDLDGQDAAGEAHTTATETEAERESGAPDANAGADEPDQAGIRTVEVEAVDFGDDEQALVGDGAAATEQDAAEHDGAAATEQDVAEHEDVSDRGDEDVVAPADEGTTGVDGAAVEERAVVVTDQPVQDTEVLDEAAATAPDDAVAAGLVDEDNCAGPVGTELVNGERVVDGRIVEPMVPSGAMMPGDASMDGVPVAIIGAGLRERWQQAQLGFIDDPRGAADQARAIAAEAVQAHIDALRGRQGELDAWQSESAPDTEVLRAAMRGYRDLVSTLTGW